jgi:hypothetical protein
MVTVLGGSTTRGGEKEPIGADLTTMGNLATSRRPGQRGFRAVRQAPRVSRPGEGVMMGE